MWARELTPIKVDHVNDKTIIVQDCVSCGTEMRTPFDVDRPSLVRCHECTEKLLPWDYWGLWIWPWEDSLTRKILRIVPPFSFWFIAYSAWRVRRHGYL